MSTIPPPYNGPERRSPQSQAIRAAIEAAVNAATERIAPTPGGNKRTAVIAGVPLVAVLGFFWQQVDARVGKIEDRERTAIEHQATIRAQHAELIRGLRDLQRGQQAQAEYMYWRLGPPPAEIQRKLGLEKEGE